MPRSMSSKVLCVAPLLLAGSPFCFAQPAPQGIHDPNVIKSGNWYYLFSTGPGLPTWRSRDAATWQNTGSVFASPPAWTADDFKINNYLWAPDVSYFGGKFHLYYAASHFGKNDSGIGHATATTLDRDDPKYAWRDDGLIVRTRAADDWNAIDPSIFVDDDGTPWMVAGSFWGGLKLMRLDAKTGAWTDGDILSIAKRSAPGAIEAGAIFKHDGYYYLLASFDFCCRGVLSSYKLMIGRSRTITGPYVDAGGRPMTEGGGTLLLSGHDNVRGPGHASVFADRGKLWVVHHFYDAAQAGRPTPQVRPLLWPSGGWPVAGEPVAAATTRPTTHASSPAGRWSVSTDFDAPFTVEFRDDGSTRPNVGRWKADADGLTLTPTRGDRPAAWRLFWNDDRTVLVGRIADDVILRGVRK